MRLNWNLDNFVKPCHPQKKIELGKPTDYPYVESIPSILSGEPIIKHTRAPVQAIVERWKFGETAQEIARNLSHIRLVHIFDALGYYDDYSDEI